MERTFVILKPCCLQDKPFFNWFKDGMKAASSSSPTILTISHRSIHLSRCKPAYV